MSAGKKLINKVSAAVDDCLEGLVAVNPGLRILDGHKVVVRADIEAHKAAGNVAVISGGGSGHEPTHGGFVGAGMLSAAVAGNVFSSPPPNSILAAVRAVARENAGGCLIVVKNYTGDRLNFGIASERAKAEGMKVDMVVVGEDCALTSSDKTAGRRGLAGVLLINKMAGALAEMGKPLEEVLEMARNASQDMGTIGLSLSPCSVPGSGPSFQLGEDEIELGLGIHGEAGVRRMKMMTAREAVDIMFKHMTNPKSSTHLPLTKGERVALMVNNLGGTSVLELNIVAKEAIHWLETVGVSVVRAYCGSFITALDMAGVSLTIMKLDDLRTQCLDAATSAPGWVIPYLEEGSRNRRTPSRMACPKDVSQAQQTEAGKKLDKESSAVLHKVLSYVCEAVGNCEHQLNTLDTGSGDGDCGSTLKKGLDAIWSALGPVEAPTLPVSSPSSLALAVAAIVEQDMGGSSGALYSLFLSAASGPLSERCDSEGWLRALHAGIQAIKRYGGAEPGDRTMLDALHPAYMSLADTLVLDNKSVLEAFGEAVKAAENGAKSTAQMAAHAGRASYVSSEHLTQPDPGAHAVGIWMRAAYEAFKLMRNS